MVLFILGGTAEHSGVVALAARPCLVCGGPPVGDFSHDAVGLHLTRLPVWPCKALGGPRNGSLGTQLGVLVLIPHLSVLSMTSVAQGAPWPGGNKVCPPTRSYVGME